MRSGTQESGHEKSHDMSGNIRNWTRGIDEFNSYMFTKIWAQIEDHKSRTEENKVEFLATFLENCRF